MVWNIWCALFHEMPVFILNENDYKRYSDKCYEIISIVYISFYNWHIDFIFYELTWTTILQQGYVGKTKVTFLFKE